LDKAVVGILSLFSLIAVFRFFIQTRTIAPPSLLASMVEATSGTSEVSQVMRPTYSTTSTSSAVSNGSSSAEGMQDLHILIVEDNIINQTVLKRQLVKAGLSCDGELLRM